MNWGDGGTYITGYSKPLSSHSQDSFKTLTNGTVLIFFFKAHSSFPHKCLISLFSIVSLFASQHKKSIPSDMVCGTPGTSSVLLSLFRTLFLLNTFFFKLEKNGSFQPTTQQKHQCSVFVTVTV